MWVLGLCGVARCCAFQNAGLIFADATTTAIIGALLALASALALYAVLARRHHGAGSLAMVAVATRYGFLLLLPGAMLEIAIEGVPGPSERDVLAILYLGIGCSAVSFALVGYAVERLDVGRIAAFFNIQVVAGVALSVLMLGEALTPARVGGGALVLGGIAFAVHAPSARPGGVTPAATLPVPGSTRPDRRGHALPPARIGARRG